MTFGGFDSFEPPERTGHKVRAIRSKEWVKVKCQGYAETRDVRWEWWKK